MEEIDSQLTHLESVCGALRDCEAQSEDEVLWRSLLREADVCSEKVVKLLAQSAIQNDESRSRSLMERLDRLEALRKFIRRQS
jgi:hypothetical protein